MQPHWTLNLKTGLKVNVPADLDHPVTLTLLELEDWPEPEHAFWNQLAQPSPACACSMPTPAMGSTR